MKRAEREDHRCLQITGGPDVAVKLQRTQGHDFSGTWYRPTAVCACYAPTIWLGLLTGWSQHLHETSVHVLACVSLFLKATDDTQRVARSPVHQITSDSICRSMGSQIPLSMSTQRSSSSGCNVTVLPTECFDAITTSERWKRHDNKLIEPPWRNSFCTSCFGAPCQSRECERLWLR